MDSVEETFVVSSGGVLDPARELEKGLTLFWSDRMGLRVSWKGDFAKEWMRCKGAFPNHA